MGRVFPIPPGVKKILKGGDIRYDSGFDGHKTAGSRISRYLGKRTYGIMKVFGDLKTYH